jgi:carboxymethylenebutenolidase
MGNMIEVETIDRDGTFNAYAAEPQHTPRGAIVVIQEIFGVNAGIRAKCDKLAAQGYLALAPDMFWRLQPGVDLDPDLPEELQQGFDLIKRTDIDLAVRDIESTIRAARARLGGRGKVGVVGFCFGGRLAYLAATRTDADASVGYYGGGIDTYLGEAHAIARPLLLHFAGEDSHITPDKVAKIRETLEPGGHVEIYEYAGADHGFATEFGKRRQDAAAELADARTAEFFAKNLG